MNLNEERTFNRILPWLRRRMPKWLTNAQGQVTGLSSPDGSWSMTSAPGPSTITSTSITDSTPVGRAVLTAADGAAARSAIGAGTSSFPGAYNALTGLPALGTASAKNAPASGNAAAVEVVLGSDTRLSDARAPTAHAHAMSDVTGLTAALGAKADTSALSAYLTASAAAAAYYPLGSNPASYLTAASITGKADKATTLAGYGITDAVTGAALTTALGNYTTTAALTVLLAAKANTTDVKRIDTYTGTTDANGLFTVTYPTAFAARPSVQPEPPANANQTWVVVSSTATGFSLRLVQRAAVTLLSVEVLLAATTNVSGASVRVVVIAA